MDEVIRRTEERLEWLSSDEETRRLYEAREDALINYNSGMKASWRQGREEGREEGKGEIARNMLRKGMEHKLIAEVTGLPLEEVRKLHKLLGKR